jgi:hypothetical protein
VADMANDRLLHETSPPPHPLDDLAEEVPADDPTRPSPPVRVSSSLYIVGGTT